MDGDGQPIRSVTKLPNETELCQEQLGYSAIQAVLRLAGNVPLIVVGIAFNLINLVVFTRARMRQSLINWFLLAMAGGDLLLLVCSWFMIPLPVLVENWPTTIAAGSPPTATRIEMALSWANAATRWALPIGHFAHTSVVSFTVALNIYRYIGLCYPFRALTLLTPRRVLGSIVGCLAFSFVFTLPRWIEIETSRCWIHDRSGDSFSILILVQSDLGVHDHYVLFYKVVAYTVFIFVLPFVVLVWVNCRIRWSLTNHQSLPQTASPPPRQSFDDSSPKHRLQPRSATLGARPTTARLRRSTTVVNFDSVDGQPLQRKISTSAGSLIGRELSPCTRPQLTRRSSSTAAEKGPAVSRMLFTVAALFLGCNLLPFVSNCLEILLRYFDDSPLASSAITQQAFTVLVECGNVLISFNSAVSLFVYLLFSSRFRAELRRLCGRCCWWGRVDPIAITVLPMRDGGLTAKRHVVVAFDMH